jgi:hypothetical protein
MSDNKKRSGPVIGTAVIGALMYFISLLPALPVPPGLSALSITTERGRWLYVALITVISLLFVAASKAEARVRDSQEKLRDDANTEAHRATRQELTELRILTESLVSTTQALAKSGEHGPAVLAAIKEAVAKVVASEPAVSTWVVPTRVEMRGTERATPSRLIGALSAIQGDPPKTATEAEDAIKRVRESVITATGAVTLPMFTASGKVSVTDPA